MPHPLAADVPDIPDAHLLEIGHIVVAWSRLESAVLSALSVAVLSDYDKECRAQAAFIHMAFPQKLQALSAILNIIDAELGSTFQAHIRLILERAQAERNAVVHHRWFMRNDEVMRLERKARKTLQQKLVPVPITKLQEVHNLIDDAYRQFFISVLAPLVEKA